MMMTRIVGQKQLFYYGPFVVELCTFDIDLILFHLSLSLSLPLPQPFIQSFSVILRVSSHMFTPPPTLQGNK